MSNYSQITGLILIGAVFWTASVTAALEQGQPANPPLVTAPWSPLNPDIAALVSTDPSGGASLVMFSGPMPAPTSDFVLRVGSARGGQVDFHGIVKPHSTWDSLAKDLCDQINDDKSQRAANVACQYSGGPMFGVTHFADNYMVVTPLTGEPLIKVYNGSQARDAGPTFALIRKPPEGIPNFPGSNCGQILFASTNSAGNDTQYVTLGCTVLSADVNNVQGLLSIYVAKTIDGAPLLDEVLRIQSDGLYVHGRKALTE